MKNNLLPIAQEGWIHIAYAISAFFVFSIFDWKFFELFALLFALFFLVVFRNPERELPSFAQNSVLSPVDGNVVSIDELDDDEYAYKITLHTSYQDVGILRAPIGISSLVYTQVKGTRLSLGNSLGEKLNEYASIVFEQSDTNKVKIIHKAKQSFFGVSINLDAKKSLIQSSRYGVMVDGYSYVYLPKNFRLNIQATDDVKATSSLLGYFLD